jgi:hypothetical protein
VLAQKDQVRVLGWSNVTMKNFAILAIGSTVCLGFLSLTIGQTPVPVPHPGTSGTPGSATGTKSNSPRIRVTPNQALVESYRKSNDGLDERVTALERRVAALEKTLAALDRNNVSLRQDLTKLQGDFGKHTHEIDGATYIAVPSVVQPSALKVGVSGQGYLFVLNSGKAKSRLSLSKPVAHF